MLHREADKREGEEEDERKEAKNEDQVIALIIKSHQWGKKQTEEGGRRGVFINPKKKNIVGC